jgi:hypothetical protein
LIAVYALLLLSMLAPTSAEPVTSAGCIGVQPAVHHLYPEVRAVVVGHVLQVWPEQDMRRRPALITQRFRMSVERVVRGTWRGDEVEVELRRQSLDVDLAVGAAALCFLERDDDGAPQLVGYRAPCLAVGGRSVLAYEHAFRELEALDDVKGTDRRLGLAEWVVACCERDPTRAMGLHDLSGDAFRRNGRAVMALLTPDHERRLVALITAGALEPQAEGHLLKLFKGRGQPGLLTYLEKAVRSLPLGHAERLWSYSEKSLLFSRLELLAEQRRHSGLSLPGWPTRSRELSDLLDVRAGTSVLADPAGARALLTELLAGLDPAQAD